MMKVFFKQGDKVFHYTVEEFQLIGDFYEFRDLLDGKKRTLHKELYRGCEEMYGDELNA